MIAINGQRFLIDGWRIAGANGLGQALIDSMAPFEGVKPKLCELAAFDSPFLALAEPGLQDTRRAALGPCLKFRLRPRPLQSGLTASSKASARRSILASSVMTQSHLLHAGVRHGRLACKPPVKGLREIVKSLAPLVSIPSTKMACCAAK